MRSLVVCLAAVVTLGACSGDSSVGVAEQIEIAQHQALWAHRDFHSYNFDLVEQRHGLYSNVRITVHADTIASVIDKDTGLPPVFDAGLPTIDGIFGDAEECVNIHGCMVRIEFDDRFGYPSALALSSEDNNPGGGYSAVVSNFQPLE